VSNVNILVIEDDPASQIALRQVLDAEEWRLEIVPDANSALQVLAADDWTLVIVNVGITGLSGSLFMILKELALAPPMVSGKGRVRVLFVVPEVGAGSAQPALEREHLPYALKPFNLHDVLEKVSDLLLEAGAIPQSIRQVRREGLAVGKRREAGRLTGARSGATRNTGMFANRSDYSSTTEEEIAEYERTQLQEESRRKKKNIKDLGSGR
jgi:DNA-binding response OmpR family regulator